MTELTNLKMEARKLLDEVNQYFQWPSDSNKFSDSYDFENISFKERLKSLKQKVHAVTAQNIRSK